MKTHLSSAAFAALTVVGGLCLAGPAAAQIAGAGAFVGIGRHDVAIAVTQGL